MYFDRFDILEAHYWYCADYHSGQWSGEYARLCRIQRMGFRPGARANGPGSENAKAIYDALVDSRPYISR